MNGLGVSRLAFDFRPADATKFWRDISRTSSISTIPQLAPISHNNLTFHGIVPPIPSSFSMTFITTESLSSPNCVRVFAQPHVPTRKVQQPSMDEINHRLAALRSIDTDEPSDDSTGTSGRHESFPMSIFMVRNIIFQILVHMGTLSSQFMDVHRITENHTAISTIMGQMMALIIDVSNGLSINLHDACMKKIQLNQRKYPVELCKVRFAL